MATGNAHKVEEIRSILGGMAIPILSLAEFPQITMEEIEETGESYEANALLKAKAVARFTGLPALADDSGLEIEALGGEPGLHSARFMGKGTPQEEKNAAILARLAGVPEERRTARFVCGAALVRPDGGSVIVRGSCEGRIAEGAAGGGGFGYDPIFWLPEHQCTMAALPVGVKNRISHRAKAFLALMYALEALFP